MGLKLGWTHRFRADVAGISKESALRLLKDIATYASTGVGDVKKLVDDHDNRWRLRSGEYRALFVVQEDGSILFISAEHRKDAY